VNRGFRLPNALPNREEGEPCRIRRDELDRRGESGKPGKNGRTGKPGRASLEFGGIEPLGATSHSYRT